jgi:hypothetical protein
MLDFCVGLDTEFSEIVEGSHLYFPKTKFEQVRTPTVSGHCKHGQRSRHGSFKPPELFSIFFQAQS